MYSMGGPFKVEKCDKCGKLYNPHTAEHECRDEEIQQNRLRLENWLGEFHIKEE